MLKYYIVVLASVVSLEAASATSKSKTLFANGAEVFKIENQNGKTPQFRVLDDNATEKALALGTIAFINSHEEVQPKVPVKDYVDLKVETLKLIPKGQKEIEVKLKLSGYELELDRTIDKKKLLSGALVELVYSPREKQIAMYNIESSGRLRMHLDTKTNNLVLQNVHAKMEYDSQFGGAGQEEIRFSGKGIRQ